MSYRITVVNEEQDPQAPIFEQRVPTVDLKRVFEAVNYRLRKSRAKSVKPDDKGASE